MVCLRVSVCYALVCLLCSTMILFCTFVCACIRNAVAHIYQHTFLEVCVVLSLWVFFFFFSALILFFYDTVLFSKFFLLTNPPTVKVSIA